MTASASDAAAAAEPALTGELLPATGTQPSPAGDAGDERVRQLVHAWLVGSASAESRRACARDLGVTPLAERTSTRYTPWLAWCAQSGSGLDPLHDVQRKHVDAWLQALAAAGLAQSTRARALATVSSWYGWLVDEGHAPANPAARVDRGRQQLRVDPDHSPTPGLTVGQVDALLSAADAATGRHAARDAAIVAVLYYLGLRVAELVGADDEDLGADLGHRTLTVTRKGGKLQALPLPPPVLVRLDAYLAARPAGVDEQLPALAAGAGRTRPLFRGEYGGRIDPTVVRRTLRRLARAADLDEQLTVHPHMLRHSCATNLLGDGAPLADVQDLLGHRDPRTTRRYDAHGRLERSPVYRHPPLGTAGRPSSEAG